MWDSRVCTFLGLEATLELFGTEGYEIKFVVYCGKPNMEFVIIAFRPTTC